MKRIAARVLLPLAIAAGLSGLAGGVVGAAEVTAQDAPSIWLLPGVDVGALLGPAVQLPTDLLKPIFAIITLIS